MKILFIASDINQIGGIQYYNRYLLTTLKELGQNVLLIERMAGFFPRARFVFKFFVGLISFRPDVVICGHINFSPLVYVAHTFFRVSYIINTHGIEVWETKGSFKLKALERAGLIVSVSNYTKDKIIRQLPASKKKIFILPSYVESKKFFIKKEKPDFLLRRHSLGAKEKVILTIARLRTNEKYKGYDKVIGVLPLILREVPNAKYVLVGAGDDLSRVKELVRNLNLEKHFVSTGFVKESELIDYYNLCDVFVMPSAREGFGSAFLGALACGKPVIAGNKDGSRDAVLDGKLGILVDPENLSEIAEAIMSVLKKNVSKSLLDRNFLRNQVLEAYGVDKFKAKVSLLINELSKPGLLKHV